MCLRPYSVVVQEDIARLVNLARKVIASAVIGVDVRHEAAVRGADLIRGGTLAKSQDRKRRRPVEAASGRGRSGAVARLGLCATAPVRQTAVEVGLHKPPALPILAGDFGEQTYEFARREVVEGAAGEGALKHLASDGARDPVEAHSQIGGFGADLALGPGAAYPASPAMAAQAVKGVAGSKEGDDGKAEAAGEEESGTSKGRERGAERTQGVGDIAGGSGREPSQAEESGEEGEGGQEEGERQRICRPIKAAGPLAPSRAARARSASRPPLANAATAASRRRSSSAAPAEKRQ